MDEKTPCEKLGYRKGDKFVVLVGENAGNIVTLSEDDGTDSPFFTNEDGVEHAYHTSRATTSVAKLYDGWASWMGINKLPRHTDVYVMYEGGEITTYKAGDQLKTGIIPVKWQPCGLGGGDGWIEWKGGEMPVERGTLVDVMFRDGMGMIGVTAGIYYFSNDYKLKAGCNRSAMNWEHYQLPSDIVAYRLHCEDGKAVDDPDCQLQPYPTLDALLHAWQKAKANADTARQTLELAEQEEATARKALDDVLRAAGYITPDEASPKGEQPSITDWRDLKPGDIVWWSGDNNFEAGEYCVERMDDKDSEDNCPFAVTQINGSGRVEWVDICTEKWHFVRHRPQR